MVARLYGHTRATARSTTDRLLAQLRLTDATDRLVRTRSLLWTAALLAVSVPLAVARYRRG